MTIPEAMITENLNWHLTQADPGQILHHMTVMRADPDALGPLGLIDPAKIGTHVYAIAPAGDVGEQLIAGAARKAITDARDSGHRILFVALSEEVWGIPNTADAAAKAHARELFAAGKTLAQHPDVEEATLVYGACSDGRRWRGRRYVTGTAAGETPTIDLLVGAPRRGESQGVAAEALLRRMVGLTS